MLDSKGPRPPPLSCPLGMPPAPSASAGAHRPAGPGHKRALLGRPLRGGDGRGGGGCQHPPVRRLLQAVPRPAQPDFPADGGRGEPLPCGEGRGLADPHCRRQRQQQVRGPGRSSIPAAAAGCRWPRRGRPRGRRKASPCGRGEERPGLPAKQRQRQCDADEARAPGTGRSGLADPAGRQPQPQEAKGLADEHPLPERPQGRVRVADLDQPRVVQGAADRGGAASAAREAREEGRGARLRLGPGQSFVRCGDRQSALPAEAERQQARKGDRPDRAADRPGVALWRRPVPLPGEEHHLPTAVDQGRRDHLRAFRGGLQVGGGRGHPRGRGGAERGVSPGRRALVEEGRVCQAPGARVQGGTALLGSVCHSERRRGPCAPAWDQGLRRVERQHVHDVQPREGGRAARRGPRSQESLQAPVWVQG
mmetsp:Transcript_41841/g.99246  ORF Transcript_41841/g.99246 Transcript_41841/m.99246 type:complete len:422 (-) Transcript_41841:360-1625(-)